MPMAYQSDIICSLMQLVHHISPAHFRSTFFWLGIIGPVQAIMPAKTCPDGPVCSDPENVVLGWMKNPVTALRASTLERLVQIKPGDGDESEKGDVKSPKVCLPTKANMIHNAAVLQELAKNMSKRMRVGADPIDVLCQMTAGFYEKFPLYKKVVPNFNLKTWAYNDAWTLHKMISQFRGPVTKYSFTRVICLTLYMFSFFHCFIPFPPFLFHLFHLQTVPPLPPKNV